MPRRTRLIDTLPQDQRDAILRNRATAPAWSPSKVIEIQRSLGLTSPR